MTYKTHLIFPRGIPASGKSTWVRKRKKELEGNALSVRILSYDTYRETYSKLDDYVDLPVREREARVKQRLLEDLQTALSDQIDTPADVIFIDNTNLSSPAVEKIVQAASKAAKESNTDLTVTYEDSFLNVSLDECLRRDAERDYDKVGEKVIRRFYKQAQRLVQEKNTQIAEKHAARVACSLAPPDVMTQAIIVDLDGTLAHRSSRRGWYDNHLVSLDSVNTPVAEIVRAWIVYQQAEANPFKLYFFSGRENVPIEQEGTPPPDNRYANFDARQMTENWIKQHVLRGLADSTAVEVHLRAHGDHRKDAAVKSEMYDTLIPSDTVVQFVLDDRNQVVDMWRNEKGIACLQVAPGDF